MSSSFRTTIMVLCKKNLKDNTAEFRLFHEKRMKPVNELLTLRSTFILLRLLSPLLIWCYTLFFLFKDLSAVSNMKNSFADLDPCTNASCKYHSHCVALSPNRFTCACESSCPSYEEQVCASNGRTFTNLCLLKQEICRTRGNYTKYHPGSCEGTFSVINKSWFSLIEESFSLWVQINKHE